MSRIFPWSAKTEGPPKAESGTGVLGEGQQAPPSPPARASGEPHREPHRQRFFSQFSALRMAYPDTMIVVVVVVVVEYLYSASRSASNALIVP